MEWLKDFFIYSCWKKLLFLLIVPMNVVYADAMSDAEDDFFVWFIIVFVVIGIGTVIKVFEEDQAAKEADEKEQEEIEFKNEVRQKMKSVEINVGGDNNGSIVLGDLIAKNSFNTIKESNIDVANALEEVGEHITSVDISEDDTETVKAVFQDLQEKIAGENAHLIKLAWDGLIGLVPSITQLSTACSAIKTLF